MSSTSKAMTNRVEIDEMHFHNQATSVNQTRDASSKRYHQPVK